MSTPQNNNADIIARVAIEGIEQFKKDLGETAKLTVDAGALMSKALDTSSASFKAMSKEIQAGTIEGYIDALKDLEVQLKKDGKSTKEVSDAIKQLSKEVVSIDAAILKEAKSVSLLDKVNQDLENGTITLKNANKQLTNELQKLALQGKQNSKEYIELRDRAGELRDAIGDVSDEANTAGSDTKGFDKLLRTTNALVGGFTGVQGAIGLFGGSGEELQKTLLKVNSAMALLQGLSAVQEELSRKDSLVTNALTKAKQLYSLAMKEATITTQLFYGVASGGLLILLGLLIANWDKVASAIGFATDNTEALAKQTEALKKTQEGQKILQDAELRYLKAKGIEQDQILKKEIAIAEAELSKLESIIKISKFRFINPFDPAKDEQQKKAQKEAIEIDKDFAAQLLDSKSKVLELKKALGDYYDDKKNKNIKTKPSEVEVPISKIKLLNLDEKIQDTFKQLQGQIDFAQQQLITEFTINPNSESLEPLSARLRDLNKQMVILQAQYKKLLNPEPTKILDTPIGIIPEPPKEADVRPPEITLFERIFGTAKENETRAEEIQRIAQGALKIVSELNNIGSQVADIASKAIQINADNELNALQEKRDKGLISEKKFLKESAKIKNEEARKQRIIDIALATAKIPLVILQALSSAPPPINYVLAGIGGALAAAQVAILAATPLPKFGKGGIIKGKSHSNGGVDINAEGGEFMIKKDIVRKRGVKFFEALNSDKINFDYKKTNRFMLPDIASFNKKEFDFIEMSNKLDRTNDNLEALTRQVKNGNYDRTSGNNKLVKALITSKSNPNV